VERGIEGEDGRLATRYTVSWRSPLDPDTIIRVVGITSCPVPPPATGERTCVTDDTPLPAKIRLPITTGPASNGSVSWLWPYQDVDGPVLAYVDGVSYVAYVVRAVNAAGGSRFVVVTSTVICPDSCMS
jgi:hypothetical protein